MPLKYFRQAAIIVILLLLAIGSLFVFGCVELVRWVISNVYNYPKIVDAVNFAVSGLVMWLFWGG